MVSFWSKPKINTSMDAQKRFSFWKKPEEEINLTPPGDLDMPETDSPRPAKRSLFPSNSIVEGESGGVPDSYGYADNYGLKDPGVKKESTLQKILSVVAGGMSGMGNGKGLFTGAAEAADAEYARGDEVHKQELDKFYKDRDFRQKGDIYQTDDFRQQAKQDADSLYNKHKMEIEDRNATSRETVANRGPALTKEEKIAKIRTKMSQGIDPSDEEMQLLELYDEE